MDHHVTRVQAWIKEHESIDCEAAFDAPATMSPRMLDSLPPTTTPKANIVIEPKLVTISSEPKRQLNFWEQSISSNCRKSTCEMPTSHKLALISHLKKSKNNNKTLQNVKAKLQSSSCTSHTYMSQALWAILMSSVPTRAFSTAQHAFPLMMWAHLCDAGMFENDFELEHCAAAFPSDWTLRRLMFHQAARDTILLGDSLRNRRIGLSCDKGNKKGVGHFVETLSWWNHLQTNENGVVHVKTQLLDTDASGGASVEAAAGTQDSMNKPKDNDTDNTHLLASLCADNGGGGVLNSLADEMRQLGLL